PPRLRGPAARAPSSAASRRGRPGTAGAHSYFQVLHDGLVALGAVIADGAQHVHLGHIARGTAARDVVGDRLVAVQRAGAAVAGGGHDVDVVELLDVTVPHVVAIHQDQRAQILDPAIAVVVGVERRRARRGRD